MKNKLIIISCVAFLIACNNNKTTETTDTNTATDSLNRSDTSQNANAGKISTDEASSAFLMDAADGGMTEVELGRLAQDKAKNQNVKNFAQMMIHDHSAANDQVKSLASQRNINIPDSISTAHKNKKEDLLKKEGAAFDKAYMDAMVKDHESTINLFEKASNNSKDDGVKSFITSTLPTIRQHLDSARSIRKKL